MIKKLLKSPGLGKCAAILVCSLILFASVPVFYTTAVLHRLDRRAIENDGGVYLSIQHETNPLELPDSPQVLDEFLSLNHRLRDNALFTYYEIYSQPLYLPMDAEGFVVQNYDTVFQQQQVPCVQLSANVLSDFSLNVQSGETFTPSDYTHSAGSAIPVLLGADYKGNFSIGDLFTADYLYTTYPFQVTGFVQPGAAFTSYGSTILMDDKIIMPSFEFNYPPTGEKEYTTQKIHYANKTSGKIKVDPAEYQAVKQSVLSLLEGLSIGEYSHYASGYFDDPYFGPLTLGQTQVLAGGILFSLLLLFSYLFCRTLQKAFHYGSSTAFLPLLWRNLPFLGCIGVSFALVCACIIYRQERLQFFLPWMGLLLLLFCVEYIAALYYAHKKALRAK